MQTCFCFTWRTLPHCCGEKANACDRRTAAVALRYAIKIDDAPRVQVCKRRLLPFVIFEAVRETIALFHIQRFFLIIPLLFSFLSLSWLLARERASAQPSMCAALELQKWRPSVVCRQFFSCCFAPNTSNFQLAERRARARVSAEAPRALSAGCVRTARTMRRARVRRAIDCFRCRGRSRAHWHAARSSRARSDARRHRSRLRSLSSRLAECKRALYLSERSRARVPRHQ